MTTLANALTRRTLTPVQKRITACIACGYLKLDARNERSYFLCTSCNEVGNRLAKPRFDRALRTVAWESAQVSYRHDPNLLLVGQIYAQRLELAALEVVPAATEDLEVLITDEDEYDGLSASELLTMLDPQHSGAETDRAEFSRHQYLSDDEIADLDALADAWAQEQGVDLRIQSEEAPYGELPADLDDEDGSWD